jgi:hypothetical protein
MFVDFYFFHNTKGSSEFLHIATVAAGVIMDFKILHTSKKNRHCFLKYFVVGMKCENENMGP